MGYTMVLWAAAVCSIVSSRTAFSQSGLQVSYGAKGVQTIQFNGVTLEDVGQTSTDAFHIWHMKSSDLSGNAISSGQYGWGESNSGESWNSATNTETYTFAWGSIVTQFIQTGNNLDLVVTETNDAGSGIIFDGAEIYPFALHFPFMPKNFYGYTQNVITTTGPGVSVADYGLGVVTSVIPNEALALYGGWKNAGGATYTPLMTSTAPDGLASFLPHNDLPLQPGTSLSYTVSLRFTPEGTAANASDAYRSFAATYPSQLNWVDRRIIGTAYLASSPVGSNITEPGGFPTNPRRYFNDASVDITTPQGLQAFQDRILAQATTNVSTSLSLSSQGVITWDLEGEQYPQSTSYVCSPDQIATVAPEMESIISDVSSPWAGMKLDDAYFRIMSNGGLRTGVCLRPQVYTFGPHGTASQVYLSGNAAIIANLENKARFANSRWGTTLFYVDSTVDTLGGTLDPAIFQQVNADLPSFLFIPEESTPRYYAYTAPFYSFIFQTNLGTPASTYLFYPQAFGANLVNDVSAGTLATYTPQLTQAVAGGDILMGHADFWQANDPTLLAIYQAAGVGAKTTPVQITPSLAWNTPAVLQYGTALSGAQLNATSNVPGSFVYTPGPGTVLNAGSTTLLTTFTPNDAATYRSATVSTVLVVNQATPVISWPVPSSVVTGTALSASQLNATADVAGSFTYSPGYGALVPAGATTLQASFTPADTVNYVATSASTTLHVTTKQMSTPVIQWQQVGAIAYGTSLSGVQLNASANVAGSFAYNPGPGSVLGAGLHTLQVTFTPADATSYTPVTASTGVYVNQALPTLQWDAPGAIVQGSALSGAQLNATANVAGSFSYTPGPGTVLPVGTSLLTATFTPSDGADFVAQNVSVPIAVAAAVPVNANLAVLSPAAAQTVSGAILVQGYVNLFLDAAGSFLIVDGQGLDQHRVTGGPFLYPLDTTTLTNGPHLLQLWGHDIGNNTTISAPVSINVEN